MPLGLIVALAAAAASPAHLRQLADVAAVSEDTARRDAALRAVSELVARSRAGGRQRPPETDEEWDLPISGKFEYAMISDRTHKMPTFDIHLDAEPEARWQKVGRWMRRLKAESGLKDNETLAHQLWESFDVADYEWAVNFVARRLACESPECERLAREADGFADAAGETRESGHTLALFYELLTACTTVVAEREDGTVTLARNLDFYPDQLLRKFVFRARWFRKRTDKKPFATSTQFAGYMGVLTARGRGFSVATNQRMTAGWFLQNWWSSVLGGVPVATAVRQVLEDCDSFACAVTSLQAARIMAPAYILVAGTGHGEGVLLQRDRSGGSCAALAGFEPPAESGLECATAPDGWALVHANEDAENEATDAELTYGRRNMARRAVLAGAELCTKGNCRAEESSLRRALEWELVSRDTTVHRDFLDASSNTHTSGTVDVDARSGKAYTTDFLAHLNTYGDGDICPRWSDRSTCGNVWNNKAAELAKDYVTYRSTHGQGRAAVRGDGEIHLQNKTSPKLLKWGLKDLLSCPCGKTGADSQDGTGADAEPLRHAGSPQSVKTAVQKALRESTATSERPLRKALRKSAATAPGRKPSSSR